MRISIELPEIPSTGYTWQATADPVEDTYLGEEDEAIGGELTRRLTFDEDPGTLILLTCCRPWMTKPDPTAPTMVIAFPSARIAGDAL